MLSLQLGELPVFCGVIGKLIVGEIRSRNDISAHANHLSYSSATVTRLQAPTGVLSPRREIMRGLAQNPALAGIFSGAFFFGAAFFFSPATGQARLFAQNREGMLVLSPAGFLGT